MKHIKTGKELKKRRIKKHKNVNYSDLIYLIHILFIHQKHTNIISISQNYQIFFFTFF
jgi:transposase